MVGSYASPSVCASLCLRLESNSLGIGRYQMYYLPACYAVDKKPRGRLSTGRYSQGKPTKLKLFYTNCSDLLLSPSNLETLCQHAFYIDLFRVIVERSTEFIMQNWKKVWTGEGCMQSIEIINRQEMHGSCVNKNGSFFCYLDVWSLLQCSYWLVVRALGNFYNNCMNQKDRSNKKENFWGRWRGLWPSLLCGVQYFGNNGLASLILASD